MKFRHLFLQNKDIYFDKINIQELRIQPKDPAREGFKDNTILVCRLVMWLICAFLRIVWGGGKGYTPLVRTSTQPDTTVGTVRFRTLDIQIFSRSKFRLCPICIVIQVLYPNIKTRKFSSACRVFFSPNYTGTNTSII